jgi:acetyltransferase-like isoleucine patch superfamily enzyme
MKWYLRELVHILKKIIKSIKTFNLRRQLSERNIYMRNATINGDDFSKLVVGDNVWINNAFLDLHDTITIEEYVSFGHSVKILTGSHDYNKFGKERGKTISKPVIIKRGLGLHHMP